MQKTTFLVLAVLFQLTAVNASETYRSNVVFNFDQPISFVERGIEFFIFPNGEFDFNTEATATQDMYYRRPAPAFNGPRNGGVLVEQDSFGRIRRIGNVFVNYDFANRIRRIGTVNISYAGDFLTQVGGLRLFYDRRGRLVEMIGDVKRHGRQYQYQYQSPYVFNQGYHPQEYYYYRADGTKASIKDKEIPEKEKLQR